jgi:hypothetical protein
LELTELICRFRANPEGLKRAASCRPPSVLAPGTALGSCRHGALSSAQAESQHRVPGEIQQAVGVVGRGDWHGKIERAGAIRAGEQTVRRMCI